MRKKIKIILGLLIIFLPIKARALTASASITCTPTKVKAGSDISCVIAGSSDISVEAVSASISLLEGMSINSFTASSDSGFQGNDVANNKIDVFGGNAKGNFKIGTLSIKISSDVAPGSLNLGLSNINFYGSDDKKNEIAVVSTTINVVKEEVKKGLKSLNIAGLTSLFEPNRHDYTAIIKNDIFSIEAIPANESDQIKIYNIEDETKELTANSIKYTPNNDGKMAVKIVVGSGGEENTYTIIIEKEIVVTYDNSLSTLTIGGKKITLIKNKYDYEVILDDISNYNVNATLSDPEHFEIDSSNGGLGNWQGATNIPIIIKAKDSSSGFPGVTYSINVKQKSVQPVPSPDSNTPIDSNPQTGNISIFIITVILLASLVISLEIYKKNISEYN